MMELETHVVECDLMNDSVSLAFSIQIELSSKVNASLCIVIIDKQSSLNPFKLISKKTNLPLLFSNFPFYDDKKPNKSTHRLSLNELVATFLM